MLRRVELGDDGAPCFEPADGSEDGLAQAFVVLAGGLASTFPLRVKIGERVIPFETAAEMAAFATGWTFSNPTLRLLPELPVEIMLDGEIPVEFPYTPGGPEA